MAGLSSTRAWVLLLAATCFLAGGAAGMLLASRIPGPTREPRPLAAYEERLVRTYDLPPARVRRLRTFLDDYHEKVEELKARQTGELEAELVQLGLTCRERIRAYVLSEESRAHFDAAADPLLAGLPPAERTTP